MEAKRSFMDVGASTSSAQPKADQKSDCDVSLASTQNQVLT